jgi:hypothetical protein
MTNRAIFLTCLVALAIFCASCDAGVGVGVGAPIGTQWATGGAYGPGVVMVGGPVYR